MPAGVIGARIPTIPRPGRAEQLHPLSVHVSRAVVLFSGTATAVTPFKLESTLSTTSLPLLALNGRKSESGISKQV